MSEQKTHAEIIAEYRHDADAMDRRDLYQPTTQYLRKALDRLEAAHKREMATVEKSSAVGNAAKLREALESFVRAYKMEDESANIEETSIAYDMAKAALSAPARNCDVGTAKEQTRRFSEFCGNYDLCMTDDSKCPLLEKLGSCEFEWGQMPYVEGGAK